MSSTANQGLVRALDPSDQAGGLALSSGAGWNQNEADWRLLLRTCRGVGVEHPGAGLVGSTMAWRFSDRLAWINMVLVDAEFRGQGIARRLMEACLRDLAATGHGALLDATDMGAPLYGRLGFAGTREIVRYVRPASDGRIAAPGGVTPARAHDLMAVAEYDARVSGMPRLVILADLQARCPAAAWCLRDAGGMVRGVVLGRDGRLATQVGPLSAETMAEAKRLLAQALAEVPGPVVVDAPTANPAWTAHLASLGFEPKRRFVRMALAGVALPTDWTRYFAISGPDFA